MKIIITLALALGLAACSVIAPMSDAPNITRLAKVCQIRNDAVMAWTEALIADLPTVETAVAVQGLIEDSNACDDPTTLARITSADSPDAEARAILTTTAISVSGMMALTMLNSTNPELAGIGSNIIAALESIAGDLLVKEG